MKHSGLLLLNVVFVFNLKLLGDLWVMDYLWVWPLLGYCGRSGLSASLGLNHTGSLPQAFPSLASSQVVFSPFIWQNLTVLQHYPNQPHLDSHPPAAHAKTIFWSLFTPPLAIQHPNNKTILLGVFQKDD